MNQEIIFTKKKTGTMLNQEDDFLNQQHETCFMFLCSLYDRLSRRNLIFILVTHSFLLIFILKYKHF